MYRLESFHAGSLGFEGLEDPVLGNRYSLLIGPNGIGKSRLLGQMAEIVVDYKIEKMQGAHEGPVPSSLLAISNLVLDPFPFHSSIAHGYRYLGLRRASNSVSTGSAEASLGVHFAEYLAGNSSVISLDPVYNIIGIERPFLLLSNGAASKRGRLRLKPMDDAMAEAPIIPPHMYGRVAHEIQGLASMANQIHADETHSSIFTNALRSSSSRVNLPPAVLLTLLSQAYGTDYRVVCSRLGDGGRRIRGLSVGELLFLSTMVRLAAAITPGSLVLIDEPETGLHPSWQSSYVSVLRSILPSSFCSHIFMATHSPYMVADADDVLSSEGYGQFVPYETEFRGQSIDSILYRVFDARVIGSTAVETDIEILLDATDGDSEVDTESARLAAARLAKVAGKGTATLNGVLAEYYQWRDR
jgi:energy-coupling factor transporter ATP-binding protein EcfA2